jgi:hypothetical protein
MPVVDYYSIYRLVDTDWWTSHASLPAGVPVSRQAAVCGGVTGNDCVSGVFAGQAEQAENHG